jgi:hypothetical protein
MNNGDSRDSSETRHAEKDEPTRGHPSNDLPDPVDQLPATLQSCGPVRDDTAGFIVECGIQKEATVRQPDTLDHGNRLRNLGLEKAAIDVEQVTPQGAESMESRSLDVVETGNVDDNRICRGDRRGYGRLTGRRQQTYSSRMGTACLDVKITLFHGARRTLGSYHPSLDGMG